MMKKQPIVSASQRRLRIAILTVGITTFLFSLLFPGWARHKFKHDHDDAVPQTAIVTVEEARPALSNQMTGQPQPPLVEVRFQDKLYYAREIKNFTQLHTGSQAKIVYRIGKTGRVYVDSVEPFVSKP